MDKITSSCSFPMTEFVNNILRIRSRSGRNAAITVRIGTDSPVLSPLTRNQIFTPEFDQFFDRMKLESGRAHKGTEARERINQISDVLPVLSKVAGAFYTLTLACEVCIFF